jgi:hypothetical protein
MMDLLIGQQISAKHPFHHDDVLKDVAVVVVAAGMTRHEKPNIPFRRFST